MKSLALILLLAVPAWGDTFVATDAWISSDLPVVDVLHGTGITLMDAKMWVADRVHGTCDSEYRELLAAAEGVEDQVGSSTDIFATTLEYRTPAMRLRERADRIDREDAAVARFRAAIKKARECQGR